jgi:4-hydroxybenzoyl-CoA thioesterase
MSFTTRTQVRFAHVDAAGIVFYPRYFEMLNGAVEDWFADALGVDFLSLHQQRRLGVPTVKLESEFFAPSRLGDLIDINIVVTQVGRTSCDVRYVLSCDGQDRVRASAVLVCMNLDAQKAAPWPQDIREKLKAGRAVAAETIAL